MTFVLRIALKISIHALREEGDAEIDSYLEETKLISIHALREEGDTCIRTRHTPCSLFLSTPSARRATNPAINSTADATVFLSTPSARRATTKENILEYTEHKFLSTPSARRATTSSEAKTSNFGKISIHALREEGD